MIKADKIKMERGKNILFDVIVSIIIHLGIKPENGGNPPKESSERAIKRGGDIEADGLENSWEK